MGYDTAALWVGAAATITYTFFGGTLAVSWTDTVQATPDDLRPDPDPGVRHHRGGRHRHRHGGIVAAKAPATSTCSGTLDFIAIVSLMAWGLGYFGRPTSWRASWRRTHHSMAGARRISMTWMILCLGGAVAIGFFGLACASPPFAEQATGVTGNPGASLSSSPDPVQPLGRRRAALRHPGGGDEVPSAASCWSAPAPSPRISKPFLRKERLPERAGVGRPRPGAADLPLIAIAVAVNPETGCWGW